MQLFAGVSTNSGQLVRLTPNHALNRTRRHAALSKATAVAARRLA